METLKQGSKNEDVKRLQLLLNSNLVPPPNLKEDGDFGKRTHDAVVKFQQFHGLKQDGIVATNTWLALGQKAGLKPKTDLPAGGPKWLEIAAGELGVHENALPKKDTERIIQYHAATTLKATTDEVPWCSSFVNWVMEKAGYKGSGSALAASWLKWGKEVPAQLGAITVIKKKGATTDVATGSATGFHVGFLISKSPTHVRLLGGNQGDQVKYSTFGLAGYDVKGIRWPA